MTPMDESPDQEPLDVPYYFNALDALGDAVRDFPLPGIIYKYNFFIYFIIKYIRLMKS